MFQYHELHTIKSAQNGVRQHRFSVINELVTSKLHILLMECPVSEPYTHYLQIIEEHSHNKNITLIGPLLTVVNACLSFYGSNYST